MIPLAVFQAMRGFTVSQLANPDSLLVKTAQNQSFVVSKVGNSYDLTPSDSAGNSTGAARTGLTLSTIVTSLHSS